MDIALASDNNYIQHLAVTMESIMQNNGDSKITFHIMNNGIRKEYVDILKEQVEMHNQNIIFYDFTNLEEEVGFSSHSSVLPISAYSRIFLPAKLHNISRIIYVDVDIVCCGSLQEVYNLELGEKIIAGVQDFADKRARIENGLSLNTRYINSGFLLIDIKKWNERNITKKIHNYILERGGRVVQEDQGAINAILKDDIKIIHPKYNAMTPFFFMESQHIKELFNIPVYYSDQDIQEAKKNPIIIHYLKFNGLVNRPWEEGCIHPKKDMYRFYLLKTYWKNAPLKKYNQPIAQKI